MQDVRACRGVDVASDDNLVIAKTLLKLNRTTRRVGVARRYETSKLNTRTHEFERKFQLELKNRFSCLSIEDDEEGNRHEDVVAHENEVERKCKKIRDTYCETVRDVLGYRARKGKSWISSENWKGIEERK